MFARTGTGAALTADLGRVYPLKYAEIQADHNDVYHVDYSTDRVSWAPWVDFPTVSAGGLQTRSSPNNLISARYLRVYPTSGDGKYSISELRPYNPNGLSYAGQGTGPEPLISISGGSTSTCLTDPAINQPPLLLFLGCNSLLE